MYLWKLNSMPKTRPHRKGREELSWQLPGDVIRTNFQNICVIMYLWPWAVSSLLRQKFSKIRHDVLYKFWIDRDHVRMYICMYVCVYVLCMYVCMSVCMYCMYVCMYCVYVLYVCWYVYMYSCMYVWHYKYKQYTGSGRKTWRFLS
jgi:hypothetical protein